MQLTRRKFLVTAATAALVVPADATPVSVAPGSFSFDLLKEKAARLAKGPFRPPSDALPSWLRGLDYGHFRMINHRPEKALWRERGLFQVQLLHRGFVFERRVTVTLLENGQGSEVLYAPELFDFRQNTLRPEADPGLGFSGFRLHFPLNSEDYLDEFAVFQGASYFRVLGRGQHYGASARGLAIDTAGPHGEEFPFFSEFWLERPAPEATTITVYALLDSKSTTGAYKFTLTPDAASRALVEVTLFPRRSIEKLGLAPLTSMFLHGKVGNRMFADQRPEVHDSDGLLIHTGANEWLFRPLVNPHALRVSAFVDSEPKGFGLLQRERDFRQYQDAELSYEQRPSLWVEPVGHWGPGSVELIEIPSDEEIHDNIVALWVPKKPLKAGHGVSFAYVVTAFLDSHTLGPLGASIGTRIGPEQVAELEKDDRHRPHRYWIDFAGGEIPSLGAGLPVEAVVSGSTGTVSAVGSKKLAVGAWRALFTFTPEHKQPSELRAFLRLHGRPLTETWTYRYSEDE